MPPPTGQARCFKEASRADLIEIVDNIAFETSAVPLPAGLPLMLLGLGDLCVVQRRRKAA